MQSGYDARMKLVKYLVSDYTTNKRWTWDLNLSPMSKPLSLAAFSAAWVAEGGEARSLLQRGE